MWSYLAQQFVELVRELSQLDSRVVVLVILIVAATIVIDLLLQRVQQASQQTGLELRGRGSRPLSIEGTKMKPVKDYVSVKQGLAGRPDALLIEKGFYIPVEHKPMGKKLRDRYVAQLLVYMRLIEEFEGKRPPYGYLIVGENARRIRVTNTEQRQAWLDSKLSEMRAILKGTQPATPAPHPKKCAFCRVRDICDSSLAPKDS